MRQLKRTIQWPESKKSARADRVKWFSTEREGHLSPQRVHSIMAATLITMHNEICSLLQPRFHQTICRFHCVSEGNVLFPSPHLLTLQKNTWYKKKKRKLSYLEVASITSRLLNGNTAGWQHRHKNEINLSRLQVQHGEALSLIRRFISVHLIQSAVLFKLSWFSTLPVCHLVSGR